MIDIIEQFKAYFNQALEPRLNVATIADRNAIDVNERYNGMKTVVRSDGKEYQLIYSGNFNALSVAAQNAFLADNNNWTESVSNAALALKEDKANKGIASGYTPLDAASKIPLQYIPDSLLGSLEYKGVWDATTNTAPSASPSNGWYYKVSVAGQTTFTGSTIDWAIGDWIIYNGTTWDRVANADKIISVNGQEGVVVIDDSTLEHSPAVAIPDWIASVYTAGKAAMRAVFDAIIVRIGVQDDQLTVIEDKLDTIEAGANNYIPPDYFGDVEILETGETTINPGVVGNSKLASMAANTFKLALVAGQPIDGTLAQVKTVLSLPTDTASDLTAKQAQIDSLIQLVASDNFNLDTIQEIVDFIEQNRTELDTYVSDLQGKLDDVTAGTNVTIDKTNPNNPVISATVPDALIKATQAQAEAGTDDTAYMTALKVLQSIAQRSGFGLSWNDTDKKFELGTDVGVSAYINKLIDAGDSGELEIRAGETGKLKILGGWGFTGGFAHGLELSTGPAKITFDDNVITISSGSQSIQGHAVEVQGATVDITSGILGLRMSITTHNSTAGLWIGDKNENNSHIKYYKGDDFELLNAPLDSPNALVPKSYVVTNKEKTAIAASRALTEADFEGNNNILPVDSASLVEITIPLNSVTPLPLNTPLHIARDGAGDVEIIGSVTFKSITNGTGEIKIAAQFGAITVIQPEIDVWRVIGALES